MSNIIIIYGETHWHPQEMVTCRFSFSLYRWKFGHPLVIAAKTALVPLERDTDKMVVMPVVYLGVAGKNKQWSGEVIKGEK